MSPPTDLTQHNMHVPPADSDKNASSFRTEKNEKRHPSSSGAEKAMKQAERIFGPFRQTPRN
ncbi:hypothetical protein TDB9533_00761 [Thalassocella blandensis]|nr:hypothetical protein TDB9533_00761 [Thalassocella blandensis]